MHHERTDDGSEHFDANKITLSRFFLTKFRLWPILAHAAPSCADDDASGRVPCQCLGAVHWVFALGMPLSSSASINVKSCVDCNATTTRAVRNIIRELFVPAFQIAGVPIKKSCPLFPAASALVDGRLADLDCFSNQDHQTSHHQQHLRCRVCGKIFRSPFYIDKHFAAKHPGQLPSKHLCLGDLCDVFDCMGHSQLTAYDACNASREQQLRQQCTALLENCVGVDSAAVDEDQAGEQAADLHEILFAEFCAFHTCSAAKTTFAHDAGEVVGLFALETQRLLGIVRDGLTYEDGLQVLRSSLEQAQLESGGIEGAAGSRVGKAIVHVIRSSLSGTAFILYAAALCAAFAFSLSTRPRATTSKSHSARSRRPGQPEAPRAAYFLSFVLLVLWLSRL